MRNVELDSLVNDVPRGVLLAAASVEERPLDVAAGIVGAAPPDEESQKDDDAQKGPPQLQLIHSGKKCEEFEPPLLSKFRAKSKNTGCANLAPPAMQ